MKKLLLVVLALVAILLVVQAIATPALAKKGQGQGNGHSQSKEASGQAKKQDATKDRGNSPSMPDQDGRGKDRGVAEPGGNRQDGNNGCGNSRLPDGTMEDDNNGWCGQRPTPASPPPTPVVVVTPTPIVVVTTPAPTPTPATTTTNTSTSTSTCNLICIPHSGVCELFPGGWTPPQGEVGMLAESSTRMLYPFSGTITVFFWHESVGHQWVSQWGEVHCVNGEDQVVEEWSDLQRLQASHALAVYKMKLHGRAWAKVAARTAHAQRMGFTGEAMLLIAALLVATAIAQFCSLGAELYATYCSAYEYNQWGGKWNEERLEDKKFLKYARVLEAIKVVLLKYQWIWHRFNPTKWAVPGFEHRAYGDSEDLLIKRKWGRFRYCVSPTDTQYKLRLTIWPFYFVLQAASIPNCMFNPTRFKYLTQCAIRFYPYDWIMFSLYKMLDYVEYKTFKLYWPYWVFRPWTKVYLSLRTWAQDKARAWMPTNYWLCMQPQPHCTKCTVSKKLNLCWATQPEMQEFESAPDTWEFEF